jgi:tetratricopeptide (TPR) repeat protein
MRLAVRGLLVALSSALGLAACQPGGPVVRIVDGREIAGAWISPEAYSAFLEGSMEEARGNAEGAARAYERALVEDPDGASIWARLGAVRCTRDRKGADAALSRAERLGPELEDVFLARAECALARGNATLAVANAERATVLSPSDVEATVVLATALERTGDRARARRYLHALTLFDPGSIAALRAYQRSLGTASTPAETHGAASDRALSDVRTGRVESATAARVLRADPGSADARIVALESADLAHDDDALARLLVNVPSPRTPPGPAGVRLLEELLERRVGPEAAAAFRRAAAESAPERSAGREP